MRFAKLILTLFISVLFLSACSDYSVKISTDPDSVPPGGKGAVIVKLKAGRKWHINPESPVNVKFAAPKGIKMEKESLSNKDREPSNTFKSGFSVNSDAESGEKSIKAEIFFMVCSGDLCKLIKEDHEISLRIK